MFSKQVSVATCSSNDTTLGCTLSNVKWATSFPTASGNDEKYEQNSVRICLDITKLTFSLATEISHECLTAAETNDCR